MIKELDTHGRPQSTETQKIIRMFKSHKKLSRQQILRVVDTDCKTDNIIKYLNQKGYIQQLCRGMWGLNLRG